MEEGTAETQRSPAADVGGAEFSYFRMQSSWGATKHMGGFKSTQELVQMCQIAPGKPILEVGCGAGMTSWQLAREYGCYINGVDLFENMIAWLKKRADREQVTERTEFRVPDVEMLPFEDNNFDIVRLCAPASKCNDKPAPTTATGSSLSESDFAQFHPTHNIDESPPDTSPRSTSPHSMRLRIARVDSGGLTSEQKAADREAKGLSYSK